MIAAAAKGDLSVEIGFAVTDEDADRLLRAIQEEKVSIFYLRIPIEFGVVNPDPPPASGR